MAIFRLSSSSISRGSGGSAVASASYRSAEKLQDEQTGKTHDYTKKRDVSHKEILLPKDVDPKFKDRQTLWNSVERAEKRVNSEFSKEYQIAIPHELSHDEKIRVIKEFSQKQFVDKGLAVDICLHKLDEKNAHAHIMTTTRSFDKETGELGNKERFFKDKSFLVDLRKDWEIQANKSLAKEGIKEQITADSYASRGIDLKGINTNFNGEYGEQDLAKQKELRSQHLTKNPEVITDILTDKNATFTEYKLNQFIDKNILPEHREQAMVNLSKSERLITIDDKKGIYTSANYLISEQKLINNIGKLNTPDTSKKVNNDYLIHVSNKMGLSEKQQEALIYATSTDSNIKNIEGYAGTGKSYTIKAIKDAYEQAGFNCKGVALSGIVADNLGKDAGIENSRTIASFLYRHENGTEKIDKNTILFTDESSLIGTQDYQKITDIISKNNAKIINVGDDNQLQAIQAGGANRLIKDNSTSFTIDEIRRQIDPQDRQASLNLSTGEQRLALEHYNNKGSIKAHESKIEMQIDIAQNYLYEQEQGKNSLILAHKKADVKDFNSIIHNELKEQGKLDNHTMINGKEYSQGDRFIFLQNDNALNVKNGTTGYIEKIAENGEMQIKTDDNKTVNFNSKQYDKFDQAYAVTIHKSQGVTVDNTQLFLDKDANANLALVGCTRHEENLQIHILEKNTENEKGFNSFNDLVNTCERQDTKALVNDYDNILKEKISTHQDIIIENKEVTKEKIIEDIAKIESLQDIDMKIYTKQQEITNIQQDIKEISQDIKQAEHQKQKEIKEQEAMKEEQNQEKQYIYERMK